MTTDFQGSVTGWIGELAGGDADEAARRLWERYFDQLVRVARDRLRASPRRTGRRGRRRAERIRQPLPGRRRRPVPATGRPR